MDNYVHDNNNPNVPSDGSVRRQDRSAPGWRSQAARDDTIMNNRFVRNNAWGVIFVPYPDSGEPCIGRDSEFRRCSGPGAVCTTSWGDALIGNTFGQNGGYGNPTNGDFAQLNFEQGIRATATAATAAPAAAARRGFPAASATHPNCDGSAVSSTATSHSSARSV